MDQVQAAVEQLLLHLLGLSLLRIALGDDGDDGDVDVDGDSDSDDGDDGGFGATLVASNCCILHPQGNRGNNKRRPFRCSR